MGKRESAIASGWSLGLSERIERPPCGRANRKILVLARGQSAIACVRNHRSVVGAELGPRIVHAHVTSLSERGQLASEGLVRTYAAGNDKRCESRVFERPIAFGSEGLNHRALEFRGDIRPRLLIERETAHRYDHSSLESAETEIEPRPIEHGTRKFETPRLT